MNEWTRSGHQGPRPDIKIHSQLFPSATNTMDLCPWYLKRMVPESGEFIGINDATIARVQEKRYIDGIVSGDKPIDGLVTGLSGTLLHEFTHTTFGGITLDIQAPGEGYGWATVGKLQNAENSDTLVNLAVCMLLSRKGFGWTMMGKFRRYNQEIKIGRTYKS